MQNIPPARPRWTRDDVQLILSQHGVFDHLSEQVVLVGRRGYYRDTMGEPGQNDRNIYDDAICVVGPNSFATFNANVDPSAHRKNIAVLKPGAWKYKLGVHGLNKPASQRYKALVQAAPVTVVRDGVGDDTGWFGINIHRGGTTTTSSLGCQTIPPSQWLAFIALVESELKRAKQTTIQYVLTEAVG